MSCVSQFKQNGNLKTFRVNEMRVQIDLLLNVSNL